MVPFRRLLPVILGRTRIISVNRVGHSLVMSAVLRPVIAGCRSTYKKKTSYEHFIHDVSKKTFLLVVYGHQWGQNPPRHWRVTSSGDFIKVFFCFGVYIAKVFWLICLYIEFKKLSIRKYLVIWLFMLMRRTLICFLRILINQSGQVTKRNGHLWEHVMPSPGNQEWLQFGDTSQAFPGDVRRLGLVLNADCAPGGVCCVVRWRRRCVLVFWHRWTPVKCCGTIK